MYIKHCPQHCFGNKIAAAAKESIERAAKAALGKSKDVAAVVAKTVSKASSGATVAASVVRSELRRSVASNVYNEVKYYRGNECSMHVIFPDDAEFASECARVRREAAARAA